MDEPTAHNEHKEAPGDTHTDTEVPSLPFSEYQSVWHFCILCIFSFGMYPFFWIFKHWQYLRDEKGFDINPSFRTALTIFYGYSLFKNLEELAVEKGYQKKLPLGFLFILFFLLSFTANLKGSMLLLFSFLAFIPLIPVLKMMNFYYLQEQAEYPIKQKLTKGEKLFLAFIWGGLFLLAFFEAI